MIYILVLIYAFITFSNVGADIGSYGAGLAASSAKATPTPSPLQETIASLSAPSNVTIGIVTWNLAEKVLDEDACSFLKELRGQCDIIAIGLQECEDIRPRRKEGRRPRKWRELHRKLFSKQYECLSAHKLGGLHLVVYAKKSFSKRFIKGIQTIEVVCGIGNVIKNKGAIALLLRLSNQETLAFVNAHLAAHISEVSARNEDYERISTTIQAQAHSKWKLPVKKIPKKKIASKAHMKIVLPKLRFDQMFHHSIFFGDLNYRLEIPRLEIELFCDDFKSPPDTSRGKVGRLIFNSQTKDFSSKFQEVLGVHDQLTRQICTKKAFQGFQEGEITFPPSFKYDKRSNQYDSSNKQRVPAYTDRVLFSSCEGKNMILDDYYSVDVRHSDHRPVCAIFTVPL